VSVSAASAVQAVTTPREQEIIDRIKPVGEVCIQGQSECATAAPGAGTATARSGADVYAASCTACHATGVGGAPKLGVAADWAARIAQGEATLLANAINGVRAMPPKGTCMNCTDEEIKLAVEHMVSNSR
jgi:cytochrome c5